MIVIDQYSNNTKVSRDVILNSSGFHSFFTSGEEKTRKKKKLDLNYCTIKKNK